MLFETGVLPEWKIQRLNLNGVCSMVKIIPAYLKYTKVNDATKNIWANVHEPP